MALEACLSALCGTALEAVLLLLLLRTTWRWTRRRPGAQADRAAVVKAPRGSTPSAAPPCHSLNCTQALHMDGGACRPDSARARERMLLCNAIRLVVVLARVWARAQAQARAQVRARAQGRARAAARRTVQ